MHKPWRVACSHVAETDPKSQLAKCQGGGLPGRRVLRSTFLQVPPSPPPFLLPLMGTGNEEDQENRREGELLGICMRKRKGSVLRSRPIAGVTCNSSSEDPSLQEIMLKDSL